MAPEQSRPRLVEYCYGMERNENGSHLKWDGKKEYEK